MRWSCGLLNFLTKSLYVLVCMDCTNILLLLYSYRTNMYFLPLLDITGDFTVRSVVICLFRSSILVNNELVQWGSGLMGYY